MTKEEPPNTSKSSTMHKPTYVKYFNTYKEPLTIHLTQKTKPNLHPPCYTPYSFLFLIGYSSQWLCTVENTFRMQHRE
jgi:hypothetical protein